MYKFIFNGLFIVSLTFALFSCSDSNQQSQNKSQQQPFESMLVYPEKRQIVDFNLIKPDLSVFTQDDFKGYWNLLFLGFTNCPDVCPTTLTDLTNIYKKISPELQSKMRILFLSVDPARDTPQHIGSYLDYFHKDLVGITGEKIEIDKLVSAIGGIYTINSEEGEFYTVDHSARIFLINPKGERYGIITSEAMHNKDKSLLVKELELMVKTGI